MNANAVWKLLNDTYCCVSLNHKIRLYIYRGLGNETERFQSMTKAFFFFHFVAQPCLYTTVRTKSLCSQFVTLIALQYRKWLILTQEQKYKILSAAVHLAYSVLRQDDSHGFMWISVLKYFTPGHLWVPVRGTAICWNFLLPTSQTNSIASCVNVPPQLHNFQ
jgi:hypothetical protein